jgi:hypothetical protein
MRLINTSTLTLTEFIGFDIPEYAILSHMWGEDEIRLQDLGPAPNFPDTTLHKAGFQKVQRFCEIAKNDGYRWAWCDTCCIDKSSSADLSEAINSMFKWCREFAHLLCIFGRRPSR